MYPLAASADDIVPLLVSLALLFAPLFVSFLSAPLVHDGSIVVHSRLFGWFGVPCWSGSSGWFHSSEAGLHGLDDPSAYV
jgi:hypothetical protein